MQIAKRSHCCYILCWPLGFKNISGSRGKAYWLDDFVFQSTLTKTNYLPKVASPRKMQLNWIIICETVQWSAVFNRLIFKILTCFCPFLINSTPKALLVVGSIKILVTWLHSDKWKFFLSLIGLKNALAVLHLNLFWHFWIFVQFLNFFISLIYYIWKTVLQCFFNIWQVIPNLSAIKV